MAFEIARKHCNKRHLADWWEKDTPGVLLRKSGVVLNKALMDVLQAKPGSLVLLLIDKPGNAFALRNPQNGEEPGAYALTRSPKEANFGFATKHIANAFPWAKSGMAMKAELVENGGAAMMVCRHKL